MIDYALTSHTMSIIGDRRTFWRKVSHLFQIFNEMATFLIRGRNSSGKVLMGFKDRAAISVTMLSHKFTAQFPRAVPRDPAPRDVTKTT